MFVFTVPEDKTELIFQTIQILYIKKKVTSGQRPNKLPLTWCSICLELVTRSSITFKK